MKKTRADQLLVERGLFSTREQARTAIMAGQIYVSGQRVEKAGTMISPHAEFELRGRTLPYVSRGGLKLEKALDVFACDPAGRVCLDCGASTGGFTDVLLQRGAARVYAVDVGYGQLAWKLRTDERVINLERTNARYLTTEQIPEPISLAVMDMSFISLRLVLPAVTPLLDGNGELLCLIKPQFEAGREQVGKKGVVRDAAVHCMVLEELAAFFPKVGLNLVGLDYSPVRGPEGNIEFLAHLWQDHNPVRSVDAQAVVLAAHKNL